MGGSGADARSLADRKQTERRRLAAALRANLSRRKAKSGGGGRPGVASDEPATDPPETGDAASVEANETALRQSGEADQGAAAIEGAAAHTGGAGETQTGD